MALRLAFVGYNEEQTRKYFDEFTRVNLDQVRAFGFFPHRVELLDGTEIYKASDDPHAFDGLRFDQIIVTCDRRGVCAWPARRQAFLMLLKGRLRGDRVPEGYRVIIYDLDANVEKEALS